MSQRDQVRHDLDRYGFGPRRAARFLDGHGEGVGAVEADRRGVSERAVDGDIHFAAARRRLADGRHVIEGGAFRIVGAQLADDGRTLGRADRRRIDVGGGVDDDDAKRGGRRVAGGVRRDRIVEAVIGDQGRVVRINVVVHGVGDVRRGTCNVPNPNVGHLPDQCLCRSIDSADDGTAGSDVGRQGGRRTDCLAVQIQRRRACGGIVADSRVMPKTIVDGRHAGEGVVGVEQAEVQGAVGVDM